jgi:KDO2-lipid IV(A) lauroyltransferase
VHAVGALLGWMAYGLSPGYRGRVRANAQRAGTSSTQLKRSIAQAGRLSAEMPWLWFRSVDRPLGALVRWDGPALIERALAAERGLVILTPHLGSFEAAARAYAERYGAAYPLTVLYRPARQAWLARVQAGARQRPGMQAVPATMAGVRQLLRALKRGQSVGLLPDQVPPAGQGAWAPFFGTDAYTMTLAARLVQQTGAALIIVWCERLARGQGYVFHQREFPGRVPDAAAAGDVAAAAAINRAMESLIRECPEQYLWGYNRYKAPRATDPMAAGPAPA